MNHFITAIGTDSGKTLVSAVVCEALGANYWKPLQAGLPRDANTIKELVTKPINIFDEQFVLRTPASPHAAAIIDNVTINLDSFKLPTSSAPLVVEGAGGCLVPLNDQDFVIDLALRWNMPVILVANLYLGSINHTLLTAVLLQQKHVNVTGIIFNGEPNPESERIILKHTRYRVLLRIGKEPIINRPRVKWYAEQFLKNYS